MTLARFLVGIPLVAIAAVPFGLASVGVRRRFLPGWIGVEARLVDVVVVVTAITLVCEALGTFGLFRTIPVTAGLAFTGLVAWGVVQLSASGGRSSVGPTRAVGTGREHPANRRGDVALATLGVLSVVGAWFARTAGAIDRGMTTADSLWYHLPVAARFVQSGRTTSLHYVDTDSIIAFFPWTSSLLHGVGILLFGSDLVSTVVNLGWFGLALAAGWVIGRPHGVAPATMLAVALVMAMPCFVSTQPGGAYNDVPGLALMLSAVAIGIRRREAESTTAPDVIAGLALGLAVGMKFTFVGPAVVLVVGLALIAPRGARVRRGAALVAGAGLTGGYWYIRNAVKIGNPVPNASLHLGPLSLPTVKPPSFTSSLARFVFDGQAWRNDFVPGFRLALGPGWVAVVGLTLIGLVGSIVWMRSRSVRMLGLVGLMCWVIYVVTPQGLLILSRPRLFYLNVRYVAPALLLGLLLVPIVFTRRQRSVLVALLAVLCVTELDPSAWPTGFRWAVFLNRVQAGDARLGVIMLMAFCLLSVVSVVAWQHASSGPRRSVAAGAAVVVLLLLGLGAVQQTYLRNRYNKDAYAWARTVHHARIAVAGGLLSLQYPWYGSDLTNFVQYGGIQTHEGGYRAAVSCAEWTSFLAHGRFDYIVIPPHTRFDQWTQVHRNVHLVAAEPLGVGFRAVNIYRVDLHRPYRPC